MTSSGDGLTGPEAVLELTVYCCGHSCGPGSCRVPRGGGALLELLALYTVSTLSVASDSPTERRSNCPPTKLYPPE
jgi:hypothetical protein